MNLALSPKKNKIICREFFVVKAKKVSDEFLQFRARFFARFFTPAISTVYKLRAKVVSFRKRLGISPEKSPVTRVTF
jgi:hypothetical protein